MTTRTHRLAGSIRVPLAIADAFPLFTPEGEREWAHGWDPHFPDGHDESEPDAQQRDDTEPGTVFETDAHGWRTTWVVTARDRPVHISYARFTAEDRAGTVTVRLAQPADGSGASAESTDVEVTYVLTALGPSAEAELRRFADGFAEYLRSWEHAIAELVARRRSSDAEA
ncbi:hypothetical protein ACX9R5_16590 [Rathayibacter sp. CAU 1779]